VAKSNFDTLVDELVELDERREADPKIMKALRTAADRVRNEAEFKEWIGDLNARAVGRQRANGHATGDDQATLRKSIEHATDLLKSAVLGGKLTAVEACAFEARIHHLSEGLR
jgi:hypothetical protein